MLNKNLILEELKKMNIQLKSLKDIDLFYSKDGIYLYRVNNQASSYVLKYFDSTDFAMEIEYYLLFHKINVPTIKLHGFTSKSLLLEDIHVNTEYRIANKEDLAKPEVGYALAHWYLQLHSKGEAYLRANKHSAHLKREIDILTEENLINLFDKLEIVEKGLKKLILNNIELLTKKIIMMNETITYNDFDWDNFVINRERNKAIVFDYNLMGIGLRYFDIRNVTQSLFGKAKESFLEAYGDINEEEKTLDAPLSLLIGLHIAFQRKEFPVWGNSLIDNIREGILEKSFKEAMTLI